MNYPIRRAQPHCLQTLTIVAALFCSIAGKAQTPANTAPSNSDELARTKAIIAHMREPLRSVPLNIVVEALTGHKVLPFDPAAKPSHAEVLKRLNAAATAVAAKIKSKGGITSKRVNEVGNTIEQYVRDEFTAHGLPASVPTGEKSGKARVTGYPDITFTFNGEVFYVDCKTYSKDTASSTMRSFYLSPSDDPKISCDAVHLIISFETSRNGDVYQLIHYKFISLEKLSLDLKYEFNSDNRHMYSGKNGTIILADAACE